MDTISLARTGDSHLRFVGELIASASSKGHRGPAENRYFVLSIYRRRGGGYVGAIGFRTRWSGELNRDFAQPVATAGDARQWFAGFNSCSPDLWRGIPDNVRDAERRNGHYQSVIRAAYQQTVSGVLASDEFAETL